uniref:Protein phosphatase n=1 Tax=Macrostomum lignano TaxID=282301 RepID=A0A1I8HC83_9PLAT
MEDARTGPLPSSNSGYSSSYSRSHGRRRERQFDAASLEPPQLQQEQEADARSYGTSNRRSKSGLRALQELVSDARTMNCDAAGSPLPSRLPKPLTQKLPRHQQQRASHTEDDFAKYLGFADAEGSTDDGNRSRRQRSTQNQSSMVDRLSCADGDSGGLEGPTRRHQVKQQQQQQQQQQQHQHSSSSSSTSSNSHLSEEDFAEEEKLCQLVGSMLDQAARVEQQSCLYRGQRANLWDAEAIAASMYPFVNEFGDRVFRLQFRTAFPFNQPEMLEMFNLLSGNFSSGSDTELLLRQGLSDLRSIHLQMRLFLHTEAALAEVDDAALSSLLLAFAEQVDRDLRSASAGPGCGQFPSFSKYARRRAAALAAAVGRFAQTAERRRRLVLGRMRGLATTVMGFVACSPSDGVADGGLRKTVVALFDDMLACF